MARPLGLVAATAWAAWLLLKAVTDSQQYYYAHIAGFIAAFATAALAAYSAIQREAALGLGLVLGGVGMVAAGMAAEFITTLLPLRAGLDVAQHGEEAYASGEGAILVLSEGLPPAPKPTGGKA